MGRVHSFHKNENPSMLCSIGNKVKTAMEIGATAKGLFDIDRSIYQGVSTYGPLLVNGIRTMRPMVAAAAAIGQPHSYNA